MGKIYEKSIGYDLFRRYIDFCTRSSYRRTDIKGIENIPTDGVVIFAPNHCNTLMDALVVLRARKSATVFGARADIFSKKSVARIMHFLRILPIVRKRDGIRNVAKNIETIDTITEVLENDMPFCIFSEGTHRTKHSLLPIGKGIARMAVAANEKFGSQKPVYIVPVGLEYGDYFRFRSTSLLTYGKPINVTEIMRNYNEESDAEMYHRLREQVTEGMSGLITYIDDDDQYEPKWALVRIAATGFRGTLEQKLMNNRKMAERVDRIQQEDPARAERLFREAEEFEKKRVDVGVSIHSFGKNRPGRKGFGRLILKIASKIILGIIGLPVFIFCALVSFPMWLTAALLSKKVKDRAFHNTVKFGTKVVFWPVMTIICGVLFFVFLPWPLALLFTILTMPAHSFFYDYTEFLRLLVSDIILANNKSLLATFYKIRGQII